MIDRFARVLVDDLNAEVASLSETLAAGRCKTFDEYKYTCGRIQGLGRAVQSISDLAKKAEESDE